MNRLAHFRRWAGVRAQRLREVPWCWPAASAEFGFWQLVMLLEDYPTGETTARATYHMSATWLAERWRKEARDRYNLDLPEATQDGFAALTFENVHEWMTELAARPPREWREP